MSTILEVLDRVGGSVDELELRHQVAKSGGTVHDEDLKGLVDAGFVERQDGSFQLTDAGAAQLAEGEIPMGFPREGDPERSDEDDDSTSPEPEPEPEPAGDPDPPRDTAPPMSTPVATPPVPGRKRGRHNYPPETIAQAKQLRTQGLTMREIGERIGVPFSTVTRWCKPESPNGNRAKRRGRPRGSQARSRPKSEGGGIAEKTLGEAVAKLRARREELLPAIAELEEIDQVIDQLITIGAGR